MRKTINTHFVCATNTICTSPFTGNIQAGFLSSCLFKVNGSIFCGPDPGTFKFGTVGKPVDCEIKIINENGETIVTGQKGELLLKGSHLMSGYFGNYNATNEVLIDNWLYTGDIAEQDNEGFVKIVGRKKNMINAGGFRIHPEEIEEVLLKNNFIDECKVIGFKDPILTEKMVACIKLKNKNEITDFEIFEYLREHLESEKIPNEIYFLDELEKGISGKIVEDKLRTQINQKQEFETSKNENIVDTIIDLASQIFKTKKNNINEYSSSSSVSGWDSLNNLVLITQLEKKFNIQFSTSEIMTMNTIQSIKKIIDQKQE